MWSSDSDLELLDMLSDWSDLSSDEDSAEALDHFERTVDYSSADRSSEKFPDDMSMYDEEDEAPSLSRDSQSKDEDSLFNDYQCHVCNKTITEFRYTCVQCSDLDLCSACEANKAHHHHYVLRVPAPRPFAEVQFVLATIRRHLMKKLDPITESEQDRDDVISVKSEIKVEVESNDDSEHNGEDENNADDANNGDDEDTDDENTKDDRDKVGKNYIESKHNGKSDNEGSNEDMESRIKIRDDTLRRSESSEQPTTTISLENSTTSIQIKEEYISESEMGQFSADTESRDNKHALATAVEPVVPVAAKRKIVIKRSDIINVKDCSSPAKIICVAPISSSSLRDTEETVTLVFPDNQPPRLQPPETGQHCKD